MSLKKIPALEAQSSEWQKRSDVREHARSGSTKYEQNGEITINPEDAVNRYKEFSFDNVFEKTYSTMKELIEK